MEFPNVGYRGWVYLRGGRGGVIPDSATEETLPEATERSELADRRWWRRVSPSPAFAIENSFMAASHKHRAVKAGVAAERVELLGVAERDGWKCGICGKRVGKRAKGRRSASLDHIVPIVCGGGNLYSNTQLVHLECNWAKQARDTYPSQMRLF